ncbi:hypothetical protein [Candidatus Nitrosocosmicus arcticus]|uniref:Uncharacterized protein n=1 Tax=Candidatus Nitrosocosmicus arcticus TaxID=2035267 RepID=A0A557SSG6_9ARCH|nr:hypothetical protein [Candidatus Nitrosocosmicus arcticus]TVP39551.1 hypothetical protein NARC_140006 [Candidatus Nitrosocosmicus arcticus]
MDTSQLEELIKLRHTHINSTLFIHQLLNSKFGRWILPLYSNYYGGLMFATAESNPDNSWIFYEVIPISLFVSEKA